MKTNAIKVILYSIYTYTEVHFRIIMVADLSHVVFSLFCRDNAKMQKHENTTNLDFVVSFHFCILRFTFFQENK